MIVLGRSICLFVFTKTRVIITKHVYNLFSISVLCCSLCLHDLKKLDPKMFKLCSCQFIHVHTIKAMLQNHDHFIFCQKPLFNYCLNILENKLFISVIIQYHYNFFQSIHQILDSHVAAIPPTNRPLTPPCKMLCVVDL